MTLVNPNGGVGYAFGAKLPSAHVNTAWAQFPYALDGNAGGTYAPSSAITINGLGLVVGGSGLTAPNISGNTTFAADITVNGSPTLGSDGADTCTLNAVALFVNGFLVSGSGTASFDQHTNFNTTTQFAGTATFDGNVVLGNAVGDTLTVNATSTFVNPVSFNGNVTLGNAAGDAIVVTGAATIQNGVNVAGLADFADSVVLGANTNDTVALRGILVNTSQGRQQLRVVETADADTSYGINDGDIFWADATIITADRVYTLSNTGAGTGDTIEFTCTDVTFQVTAGGLALRNASGFRKTVKFVFRSGGWHPLEEHWVP